MKGATPAGNGVTREAGWLGFTLCPLRRVGIPSLREPFLRRQKKRNVAPMMIRATIDTDTPTATAADDPPLELAGILDGEGIGDEGGINSGCRRN